MKAKQYWLAASLEALKNALHKSITKENLLPVGMEASRVRVSGTAECRGERMWFTAQESWTSLQSHSQNGNVTETSISDNVNASYVIFYYGLCTLKGLCNDGMLINPRKRF